MDAYHNPFSPGAGNPPPELAGRAEILDQAMLALARTKRGRSEKSMLLVGLRGVGKTVLLRKIGEMAIDVGYQVMEIEAQENKSLPALLYPHIRAMLRGLNKNRTIGEKAAKAFGVFRSFVSGLKIKYNDLEFGWDGPPETGIADSGDLEADLPELFMALAEAAREHGTAIAVIIDELQYLSDLELSALIMAAHRIAQRSLPLVIIGAGLPQLVGKAGNAKSYAERLFSYPNVGALTLADTKLALQEPAHSEGAEFTEEALAEIATVTECYPYFLQEWGYSAWNTAPQSPITLQDVRQATASAIIRLDENFFRVRFDRLTPREKKYMRALAALGSGPQRSGDVAVQLGVEVNTIAPLRNNLIKKGMIYSPAHGDTAFTVPLFEGYMKRVMPDWPVV